MVDAELIVHRCEMPALGGRYSKWRANFSREPFWRLYWNSAPGMVITVAGKECGLKRDAIYLMAPDTVYSGYVEGELHHLFIHFSTGFPLTTVAPFFLEFTNRRFTDKAQRIAKQLRKENSSWRLACHIKELCCSVLAELPADVAPSEHRLDARILDTLARLNTLRKSTNRELANAAGMSLSSFQQLFQDQVGMAPQVWFNRKRLEKACHLLRFTEQSIERIAEACGFCDRYHLSKAFRKQYGDSPGQYRKRDSDSEAHPSTKRL